MPEEYHLKPFSSQAQVMGTRPWEGTRVLAFQRSLLAPLATPFYRFLARFSGRRRTTISYHKKPPWHFLVLQLVLVVSSLVSIVESCSSRSTPKPRPPAPTPRPNITFLTYPCPPDFAAWFCFNGATCFTVKIKNDLVYNCLCAEGYQGARCEYKDLDGSYLPSRRRFMMETASIAGGATIAVFSAVILCLAAYLRWRRRRKNAQNGDQVDGHPQYPRQLIFGVRPQGQNLVPIHSRTHSPPRVIPGGSSNQIPGGTNPPLHEPNLLNPPPSEGGQQNAARGMPHDRGDTPATLLRGAAPWDV